MAKPIVKYVCRNCKYKSLSRIAKCPKCFKDVIDIVDDTPIPANRNSMIISSGADASMPIRANDIEHHDYMRYPLAMSELNRVLGGGLVRGSYILLSGQPGSGKSTMALHILESMLEYEGNILYISGEESIHQVNGRMGRMKVLESRQDAGERVLIWHQSDLESALKLAKDMNLSLLILDSMQTMYSSKLESSAGSPSQVVMCANLLMNFAKSNNIIVLVIGHVIKDGDIAGPKTLEHLVDALLYLDGGNAGQYRILRANKNRFGSTNEIGMFSMSGHGFDEVPNPSAMILNERLDGVSGSALTVITEGMRPIIVEVQALVVPSPYSNAKRTTNGANYNRVLMLIAVLSRHCNLKLSENDVFINIAGGFSIDEPALDMGVAGAIISSYLDAPIDSNVVFLSEVGLNGELRSIPNIDIRIGEAVRMGFEKIIVAKNQTLDTNLIVEYPAVQVQRYAHIKGYVDTIK